MRDLKETPLWRELSQEYEAAEDKFEFLNAVRGLLHDLSPNVTEPVDYVQWIPKEKVQPNDYNPNAVAHIEMGLLAKSIDHDGYTQPVVTIYDPEIDKYVVVDGFHRYAVMTHVEHINERCHGRLPCVVLDKTMAERMASTVRHNRARGKHSVAGMANLIFKMLGEGMTEAEVCNELGLEPEELLRLQHITGFSKLFKDHDYNKAWVTWNQVQAGLDEEAAEAAGIDTTVEGQRKARSMTVEDMAAEMADIPEPTPLEEEPVAK